MHQPLPGSLGPAQSFLNARLQRMLSTAVCPGWCFLTSVTSFKLTVTLLPQLPGRWGYSYEPLGLASTASCHTFLFSVVLSHLSTCSWLKQTWFPIDYPVLWSSGHREQVCSSDQGHHFSSRIEDSEYIGLQDQAAVALRAREVK